MKIRKPRISIGSKGVRLTNVGARIGSKRAGVNLSRSGTSFSGSAGGASYNSKKGCRIPLFSVLVLALAVVLALGISRAKGGVP